MRRARLAFGVALILASLSLSVLSDTIKIAFWNTLHFGNGKSECKDIKQIADILENYDFVALAEVMKNSEKDPDESPCATTYGTEVLGHLEALVAELCSRGQTWSSVVSPEARGRSDDYREYYVFLHNHRVQLAGGGCFFPALPDVFEREPFFAPFIAGQFDFTVIVHHAIRQDKSPELKREIEFLDDVFLSVRGLDPFEDDIILLGDFNVKASVTRDAWWNELRSISGMTALINEPTSLGKYGLVNPYDKVWIDSDYTGVAHEFTGNAGILKFWDVLFSAIPEEERYEYAYNRKGSLSDHVPIWAEFTIDFDDDPVD